MMVSAYPPRAKILLHHQSPFINLFRLWFCLAVCILLLTIHSKDDGESNSSLTSRASLSESHALRRGFPLYYIKEQRHDSHRDGKRWSLAKSGRSRAWVLVIWGGCMVKKSVYERLRLCWTKCSLLLLFFFKTGQKGKIYFVRSDTSLQFTM